MTPPRALRVLPFAIALSLGSVVPVASAQDAVVAPKVEKGDPAEIDAEMAWFRDTLQRAERRSQDFKQDILATYEAQRSAQISGLTASYDDTIAALDRDVKDLRDQAIVRFEAFLRRHDDIRATSDVRLRLAELEFQLAQDRWLDASEEYNNALRDAGDDLVRLSELQEQGDPMIDLSRPVQLLTGIIEANEGVPRDEQYDLLDVAYYMLAYVYYNATAEQFDKAYAQEIFQDLIDARPDSEYVDSAHLLRGRYLFSDLDDVEASMPEFEAVIASGPEGDWYADAVYYKAWGRYKQSRYEEALAGFRHLLELSADQEARTGKRSDYAPEAITYIGLTLLEQADEKAALIPLELLASQRTPILVELEAYFAQFDEEPDWRWDVYANLAEALVNYTRYEEAVEMYRYLQEDESFRLRPENPTFQDAVVRILSRGYGANLEAAGQARIDMTDRYGEGSEWWTANRADPEALATARGYIETYLLDVAIEFRIKAQEALEFGDEDEAVAMFLKAAERYQDYLTRFPVSDGYFENQFFLADSLLQGRDTRQAEKEFNSLVRNARYHEYADISVYQLARVRERILLDEVGPFGERAPNAQVEEVLTTGSGGQLTVYQLLPEQVAFQEAVDRALAWEYGPQPEGIGDMAEVLENTGHQLSFLVAQMLFYANRFDEARPRLMAIIEDHPNTIEASYAATLYVNSFILEEDYAQVRKWSREFSTRRLGPDQTIDEAFFRSALEQSTYEIGIQAYANEEYEAAAAAFLEFVDEFGDADLVPNALISAASAYAELGRFDDANTIYVDFLKQFPRHEEAPAFYLLLAENYGATFQLDKAITYYSDLIDRFPSHPNAAIATYMIAFLKEGLGDHIGAARGYEAYARQFPDEPDRESTHYRAGAQYELVSDDRAIAFYTQYLRTYGVDNPDHALEAQAKLAELYNKKGQSRAAAKALDNLVPLFDKAVEQDKTIGPKARDLAAAAAWRDVQALYDEFVPEDILEGDFQKLADFLFNGEGEEEIVAIVEAADALAEKYLSFEYTTASMYVKGAAAADFAAVGYGVQPPANYTGPQLDAFWNLLEQTVYPRMDQYRQDAVALLTKTQDLATSQKRHSVWVDKATLRLNELDPSEYPAGKDPVVSDGKVEAVPALPIRRPQPKADATEAGSDEGGTP